MKNMGIPVTSSPSISISELVFVYENPTPTGVSKNNKFASTDRKQKH